MIAKLNHEKMLKARQAAVRASSRQRSRTPGIKFTSLSGAWGILKNICFIHVYVILLVII